MLACIGNSQLSVGIAISFKNPGYYLQEVALATTRAGVAVSKAVASVTGN
jgi:hypothetical protein